MFFSKWCACELFKSQKTKKTLLQKKRGQQILQWMDMGWFDTSITLHPQTKKAAVILRVVMSAIISSWKIILLDRPPLSPASSSPILFPNFQLRLPHLVSNTILKGMKIFGPQWCFLDKVSLSNNAHCCWPKDLYTSLWFWDILMEIKIVPICSVGLFCFNRTARFMLFRLFHQPTFNFLNGKSLWTCLIQKITSHPLYINALENASPKIWCPKHVNNQFIIKARVCRSWTAPRKHLGLSERPHWNLNGPIHLWSNQQKPKEALSGVLFVMAKSWVWCVFFWGGRATVEIIETGDWSWFTKS